MARYFVTGTVYGTDRHMVLFRSPRSALGPATEWVRRNTVALAYDGQGYFSPKGVVFVNVAVRIEVEREPAA